VVLAIQEHKCPPFTVDWAEEKEESPVTAGASRPRDVDDDGSTHAQATLTFNFLDGSFGYVISSSASFGKLHYLHSVYLLQL